jgi:hypothetical protein
MGVGCVVQAGAGMKVTNERLEQIVDSAEEDLTVRELAAAILELRNAAQAPGESRRMAGKPLAKGMVVTACSKCYGDITQFVSKKPPYRPYLCDVEMGTYDKTFQPLSAPNWLHRCREGR